MDVLTAYTVTPGIRLVKKKIKYRKNPSISQPKENTQRNKKNADSEETNLTFLVICYFYFVLP